MDSTYGREYNHNTLTRSIYSRSDNIAPATYLDKFIIAQHIDILQNIIDLILQLFATAAINDTADNIYKILFIPSDRAEFCYLDPAIFIECVSPPEDTKFDKNKCYCLYNNNGIYRLHPGPDIYIITDKRTVCANLAISGAYIVYNYIDIINYVISYQH